MAFTLKTEIGRFVDEPVDDRPAGWPRAVSSQTVQLSEYCGLRVSRAAGKGGSAAVTASRRRHSRSMVHRVAIIGIDDGDCKANRAGGRSRPRGAARLRNAPR
ncbi:hypothetical protein, partial [Burkholderia sp. IDO3]|uniref:hypothetical protein n=1 Tax=Burkholderia sp. IDO3 TaxID=1705310 RepID=UPI001C0E95E1